MLQTRAQRYLRQKLCHRSMVAWKVYINQNRNISAAAHVKYLAKCQQTLRSVDIVSSTWLDVSKCSDRWT